ncbi:hypothetical protein D3C80_1621810 [compost metagenome]
MVMRFNFEHNRLIVADIHDTRAFTRPHKHARSCDRELFQDRLGIFVRAVLRPHDTEYTDLRIVRLASQKIANKPILVIRYAELTVNLLIGNLLRRRFLSR